MSMALRRQAPSTPPPAMSWICVRNPKRAAAGTTARARLTMSNDAEPDAIDLAAITEKLPPLQAFLRPAGLQECADRADVVRIAARCQLTKAERLEGEPCGQRDGFTAESLSPSRFLPEHQRN